MHMENPGQAVARAALGADFDALAGARSWSPGVVVQGSRATEVCADMFRVLQPMIGVARKGFPDEIRVARVTGLMAGEGYDADTLLRVENMLLMPACRVTVTAHGNTASGSGVLPCGPDGQGCWFLSQTFIPFQTCQAPQGQCSFRLSKTREKTMRCHPRMYGAGKLLLKEIFCFVPSPPFIRVAAG